MVFLRFFSNCIPVKGYNQSTICDLQKGRYFVIPNLLYEILHFNETNRITFNQLLETYKEESEGIEKYVDYLVEKGMMFYTTTPEKFPPLSMEFDYPAKISNSIIDCDEHSDYLYHLQKVTSLGCRTFQVRFFEPISVDKLLTDMRAIHKNEQIHNLEVVLPFFDTRTRNLIYKEFPKVTSYFFYNSPYEKTVVDKDNTIVKFFVKRTLNENECGEIKKANFMTNIMLFTESQHHNNCLNRKLSVDRNGFLKNCPSMPLHFGKIQDVELSTVLMNKKFTSYWKLKKDDIKTCKDCEYRYICSDCRVFIQDQKDIRSKPSKCSYDPYQNTW